MKTVQKRARRSLPELQRDTLVTELQWLVRQSSAPRIRPLRQFAEEEIVIPEGKHNFTKWKASTLPWTGLLYREIDSGRWNRVISTGNVQGGKTLNVYLIPLLWHIFEWRERVIAGVPDMKTAADKFLKEFMPTIAAQPRFARYLPTSGRGSKGGFPGSIMFTNGAELRFMIGGGGEENRSNVTSRVAACTEADRLDAISEVSREASPIYQIEARTASFAHDARIYNECTVTTETGYVWREIQASTASRIMCPCVHCPEWVSPERDDFVGFLDAKSELHAGEIARFHCPACGEEYADEHRRSMNNDAKLVHRGQTIDRRGDIHGEPPGTRTLGFRWSAFNNLLWDSSYIGEQAYRATHDRDLESAERKMRQWYWVLPLEPDETVMTPISADDVRGRQDDHFKRGILPPGTVWVTAAADCRKTQIHFVVIAWLADGRGIVIDMGILPVESPRYGVRKALRLGLRALAARLDAGYPRAERMSERLAPGWCPIDGGYKADVVRAFCKEKRAAGIRRYLPSFGRGQSQNTNSRQYRHPEAESQAKPHIGEQYYLSFSTKYQQNALIVNADHWKQFCHEGLTTPLGQPGAIAIFEAATEDEAKLILQFARQTAAERAKEIFVPGRGPVIVYENETRRLNHFLDAFYNACAVGHFCGVRVVDPTITARDIAAAPRTNLGIVGPSGQAFLASERDAA